MTVLCGFAGHILFPTQSLFVFSLRTACWTWECSLEFKFFCVNMGPFSGRAFRLEPISGAVLHVSQMRGICIDVCPHARLHVQKLSGTFPGPPTISLFTPMKATPQPLQLVVFFFDWWAHEGFRDPFFQPAQPQTFPSFNPASAGNVL